MRWTRQRRARSSSQGRSVGPVSEATARQTNGAEARRSLLAKTGGCVRQKRAVLAPVAGAKSAEVFANPTGACKTANPPLTVAKGIRRLGQRAITRETIAPRVPEALR